MPRGSQRARACGDSARATAASQAHDRELNPQELSSLCAAAKAIGAEIAREAQDANPRQVKLIIDGRKLEHGYIPALHNSRAARFLDKDPRGFGATVKRLYLSGSAGGAELRELLAYNEIMDTDRPEFDSGVASGGATPTLGGARDAAG